MDEKINCWLNNRDLLDLPRQLVHDLQECDGVGEITIVDCASTYPPLLDWYARDCPCRVIREANLGNQAVWRHTTGDGYYFFSSDADIDIRETPRDFLLKLREGLERWPESLKAGLSLMISDLPDASPVRATVVAHESQFWVDRLDAEWFRADVDTVAALYPPGRGWGGYGPSLRSAPPYVCRHTAWYLTPDKVPEDWQWYLDHLSRQGIVWGAMLQESLGRKA